MLKIYGRVYVPGLSPKGNRGYGEITKIRKDDLGNPIYTVTLDNHVLTPGGYIYARDCELIDLS